MQQQYIVSQLHIHKHTQRELKDLQKKYKLLWGSYYWLNMQTNFKFAWHAFTINITLDSVENINIGEWVRKFALDVCEEILM